MRKLIFFLGLFLFINLVQAQSTTTGLSFDYNRAQNDGANLRIAASTIDTLQLPFIDDFSTSGASPDTSHWLNEGGVLVNNNYAVNPPSLNVATFDGIMADGFPYVFPTSPLNGTSANPRGEADYLISKPIDISALDSSSHLAFSFYWQKGSHHPAQTPSLNQGDTLKLFFLNKDSVWVKVWPFLNTDPEIKTNYGVGKNVFTYKQIQLTDSLFFHDAFQFKFTSYGTLDGNYSIWSVDYIYLDSGRVTKNIQDFAFGNQLSPLLNDFYAVPYRQFQVSPLSYLSNQVTTGYSNLSNKANLRDTMYVKVSSASNGSPVVFDQVKQASGLPAGGTIEADTTVDISWTPNQQAITSAIEDYKQTNFALNYQVTLSGTDQVEILKTNDSISETNYLSNYFAYDDGTAEGGIKLEYSGYFEIAYEFEMKTRDTLTAIYIYWSRAGFDIRGTSIDIKVWKSLPEVRGATVEELYLKKIRKVISYGENFGQFTKIEIPATIIEAGYFYVGWGQNINNKVVKIGADFSQDNRTRFYEHSTGKWENPRAFNFYGTPMIRPKFGYDFAVGMDDLLVGVDDLIINDKLNSIDVYPNPADYKIKIDGACKSFQMFDVTGNIVLHDNFDQIKEKTIIETDRLNPGIYFLQVFNGVFSQTKKMIIYH